MGTNDAAKAKRIFGEALGTPADRRGGYLDKVCRGDAKLRAQVEALLVAHDQAGEFLGADLVLTYATNSLDYKELVANDALYYPRFLKASLVDSR